MKFTTIGYYFFRIKTKFACSVLCLVLLFSSGFLAIHGYAASVLSYVVKGAGNVEIYCADTTGNILLRIPTDAPNMGSLSWSPDGRFVAYQSNHEGAPNIYVLDIQNKTSRRLTNHEGRNMRPIWSPNGKWIAFISDRAGNLDIYRIDVDGSNLRRLTNRGNNRRPGWSPDSQQIAFVSSRDDKNALYVMTADGKGLRRLKKDFSISSTGSTWSPDGKQIAFVGGNLFTDGLNVYVIGADGNNFRRLTHGGAWSWTSDPAWSPDGAWIAYTSREVVNWPAPGVKVRIDEVFGKCTIYVINAAGEAGEPHEIVNGLPLLPMPAWAPEGFLSVSPGTEKQTTLWGRLKQRNR